MTEPLVTIQQLIDQKRAVYCSTGLASSTRGSHYFTIWGNPSDKILATGYGNTISDAARDAISQVSDLGVAPAPRPSLPGTVTRPTLPGMTR